ncbi:E3 ubiquitin-protein ligase [Wickerhamomyces ciferrii]|uniref:E3 ubiquitin-protein ligase n=1 Tax=Wickerhamomyces ciferrii (strain ATCC 14091 / BCRC 22168 / CBS 111 / JCM 3599 / NBRC 0793 / NRRL Y-1031 F-60-10) TaxID=1206466 RepID=K0KJD2_WICCF|nr:E3 ubiquitin-protein ligase [Wickerhamomyces ciferrii]CCH41213.1 E3 ubiquitin-protein ligase [Wickerhamomyces ciferrii]
MDENGSLARLPTNLAAMTLHDHTEKNAESLWSLLYYVSSKDGQYLKDLFPLEEDSNIPKNEAQAILDKTSYFKTRDQEKITHIGRNCGRKFKRGEPIYRCLDCSFDNTCVLCVHCFNKEDHHGHQVSAAICSGSNTGICDCGDPEAWKRELHCKCNSKAMEEDNTTSSVFDASYELYLQKLFDTLLDFIIEVFANQNQTIPVVNKKLKTLLSSSSLDKKDEAKQLIQDDIEKRVLKDNKYNDMSTAKKMFVVLWNDEFHNFPEAQSAIISATHDSPTAAKLIATRVDSEGRTVLLEGTSLDRLISGYSSVQSNGLTATVMSEADFLRQDYSKSIIDWILDAINLPNVGFQRIARRALCKSLCATFDSDDAVSPCWSSLYSQVSGLLNAKNLPYVAHESIDPNKDVPSAETTVGDISNEVNSLASQTRLQYLLFFDIRYWKVLRKKVHDLLIPPLVSDLEYKIIAADQIVEIYGLLINGLSKLDREPHLNSLDEIACQFFTCPTNSTNVVGSDKIRDVLFPVIHLFESFSTTNMNHDRKFKIPHRAIDKSTSFRKAFSRTINDLIYLFEKTTTLKHFFESQNFLGFCFLIRLFDSNWCIERKTGEHVEVETYAFVDYFSYALQLLGVIYGASDPTKLAEIDGTLITDDIRKLVHLLSLNEHSTKTFKTHNLIDFQVSSQPTGFMNPSNVFLSRLIESVAKSSKEITQLAAGYDFLQITDSSLKAVVLCAQIESQFWVRNGLNALKQANTYKSPQLMYDSVYYRDIHLTQVALLATDPERAFLNIIDRFELLNWFSSEVQVSGTVYEDKVFTIIEKLISFLYVLLSERSLFMEFESKDKSTRHKLKQVLIYSLFAEPLTYSEMEESLYEELSEFEGLDEVLNEVSEFTPPRGLNDDGRYKLRPEYYKLVDPLKLLAQVKDFQDNTMIISKTLSKQNKVAADDIVIEPKLSKLEPFKELGDFAKTKEFAKFVYKLLEFAIQHDQESYVPQLLHLLHGVFKDDELYNGQSFVSDAFIQIPICESLFAISTSANFSKQTTRKADYLLESLLVKDSQTFFDSLLSCFGEEAVNSYKEKKKSVGVNFDETEPERKRRLAKERQKKIMEKMSKKQKIFIEKNDEEPQVYESEGSVDPGEVRSCVFCQGSETKLELFGFPISYVKSSVFRHLPADDKYSVKRAFTNWGSDSIGNNSGAIGIGFPLEDSEGRNYDSLQIATSCNHGMHYKCLRTYMNEHNRSTPSFACPLCKTYHTQFYPVIPGYSHLDLKSSSEIEQLPTFLDLFKTSGSELTSTYLIEYHEALDLLQKSSKYKNITNHYDLQAFHLKKLTNFFASTIDQTEISTRINGSTAYTNFLNQIPQQSYMVLRALFESLGLVQGTLSYFESNVKAKPASFTHQFLSAFIYGKGSLSKVKDLLRSHYIYNLGSLINRAQKFGEFPVGDINSSIKDSDITASRELINNVKLDGKLAKSKFLQDDQFAYKIIQMAQALLVPAVRSICIFLKVVNPEFQINHQASEDKSSLNILLNSLFSQEFTEILEALKPHKLGNIHVKGAGKLPYPGVIKLVDLPYELNYFTTETNSSSVIPIRFADDDEVQNSGNRIDFCICLTCGKKVFKGFEGYGMTEHTAKDECDSGPDALFLIPNTDVVHLVSDTSIGRYAKAVNAPYLNAHGQSGAKAVQNGQLTKLNIERYKYLNNLWLSGSIFSYLSRNSSPTLPRFGMGNLTEQTFWRQFLNTARADLAADMGGEGPLILDLANNIVGDDGDDGEEDDDEEMGGLGNFIVDEDVEEEEFDDDDDDQYDGIEGRAPVSPTTGFSSDEDDADEWFGMDDEDEFDEDSEMDEDFLPGEVDRFQENTRMANLGDEPDFGELDDFPESDESSFDTANEMDIDNTADGPSSNDVGYGDGVDEVD